MPCTDEIETCNRDWKVQTRARLSFKPKLNLQNTPVRTTKSSFPTGQKALFRVTLDKAFCMENFSVLSPEQLANPLLAIREIFEYASCADLEKTLWLQFKNTDFKHLSYSDKSEISTTYELIVKLVRAANLLCQQRASPI